MAEFHEDRILHILPMNSTISATNTLAGSNSTTVTPYGGTNSTFTTLSEAYPAQLLNASSIKVFNELRSNINKIINNESSITITADKQTEIYKKYNLDNTLDLIEKIKKNIITIYENKLQAEYKYSAARDAYQNFNENISQTLQSIDQLNIPSTEEDKLLKELISTRNKLYYEQLEIDKHFEEFKEAELELSVIKKFISELSPINDQFICTICQEKTVTHFIDPCGHTLCEDCMKKCTNVNNCHYCRVKRTGFRKLFLN